jgi:hypothetical protein
MNTVVEADIEIDLNMVMDRIWTWAGTGTWPRR